MSTDLATDTYIEKESIKTQEVTLTGAENLLHSSKSVNQIYASFVYSQIYDSDDEETKTKLFYQLEDFHISLKKFYKFLVRRIASCNFRVLRKTIIERLERV